MLAADEFRETEGEGVPWVAPRHSRQEVNAAAKLLLRKSGPDWRPSPVEWWSALGVVNNWRAAHSYPLNAATADLRQKAKKVYASAIISRRIKRLPSILTKLERYPELSLTRVQDIGGCRAVVTTVSQVRRLVALYRGGRVAEHIGRVDDYIQEPRKDSGYRGVHLIYKYEDKQPEWEGLKVEIQLRSRPMHAWATAVEIVDTFTQQTLKTGGGEEDWRRFFRLMASTIAAGERAPLVSDTPSGVELKEELSAYATRLDVVSVLTKYRGAVHIAETAPPFAHWFVMVLDSTDPGGVPVMLEKGAA